MAAVHSKRNSVRVTRSAPEISSANTSKDVSNGHFGDVSPSYYPTAAISPFRARNRTAPVALPKLRHCTMGYNFPCVKRNYASDFAPRIGPEPPPVPFLRLQGRWLHRAGFAIGTPLRVLVTPGRLVLEVDRVT